MGADYWVTVLKKCLEHRKLCYFFNYTDNLKNLTECKKVM